MRTVLEVVDEDAASEQLMQRIGAAYRAVFTGDATSDDVDLVLIDLAQFARYYDTAEIGADPVALAAVAHRKAVLDHIMDGVEQSGAKLDGLRVATLRAPNPYTEE